MILEDVWCVDRIPIFRLCTSEPRAVTLGSTPSRSDAGGGALSAEEEKAGDEERVDKMIPRINFLHIVGS